MILLPITVFVIIALIGYLFLRRYLYRQYLLKNGIPTVATTVSVTRTIAEVHNDSSSVHKPIMEMDFGVQPEGEVYRLVTIKHAFDIGERVPAERDKVIILIDPKKPDKAIISPYQHQED